MLAADHASSSFARVSPVDARLRRIIQRDAAAPRARPGSSARRRGGARPRTGAQSHRVCQQSSGNGCDLPRFPRAPGTREPAALEAARPIDMGRQRAAGPRPRARSRARALSGKAAMSHLSAMRDARRIECRVDKVLRTRRTNRIQRPARASPRRTIPPAADSTGPEAARVVKGSARPGHLPR
jgi:hypothetical protein